MVGLGLNRMFLDVACDHHEVGRAEGQKIQMRKVDEKASMIYCVYGAWRARGRYLIAPYIIIIIINCSAVSAKPDIEDKPSVLFPGV